MAANSFTWGNRTWGANDLAAFKKWLAKRGANYATWARKHPGAAKTFRSSTPSRQTLSYEDVANKRAEEAIQPELTFLEGDRANMRDYFNRLLEQQAGVSAAGAELLKGIAPAVGQIYGDAGDAVASYGRGLGDVQNEIQAGERADAAKTLENSGASAEQVAQVNAKIGSDAAGDVVYGVGGYIPAADLQSQGAAAQTFAAGLPADALAQGEQSRRESIAEMLERDMDLLVKIQAAKAKIPALRNENLQQLLDNRRAEDALQVQKSYLGNTVRRTDAELTGIDPVTGLPTLEVQEGVAEAQGKQADARKTAVRDREQAFVAARQDIFADAKGLGGTEEVPVDPQRPWLGTKRVRVTPSYAEAKRALFDQYKHLLRFGTRSGQAALKRRLNKMIDEALRAAGIKPVAAKRPSGSVRPDDRPGPRLPGG